MKCGRQRFITIFFQLWMKCMFLYFTPMHHLYRTWKNMTKWMQFVNANTPAPWVQHHTIQNGSHWVLLSIPIPIPIPLTSEHAHLEHLDLLRLCAVLEEKRWVIRRVLHACSWSWYNPDRWTKEEQKGVLLTTAYTCCCFLTHCATSSLACCHFYLSLHAICKSSTRHIAHKTNWC